MIRCTTFLRLLLLSALSFGVSSTPAWELDLQPEASRLVDKKTGDNIAVLCTTVDISADNIKWFRMVGDHYERIPEIGRVRDSNGQLFIFAAKKTDATSYKCEATYEQETKAINFALEIFEDVSFVDAARSQHPRVGAEARLVCRVSGDPRPTMIWAKDAHPITFTEGGRYSTEEKGQVLVINTYDAAVDDGLYECAAMQGESGDFKKTDIQVSGFVAPILVDHPVDNTTELQGQSATFTCSARGRPLPTITWYKGDSSSGKVVHDSDKYRVTNTTQTAAGTLSTGLQMQILDLTPADMGPYTCVATNALDTDQYMTFLNVFVKPSIVPMSSVTVLPKAHVQLVCEFSGDGDLQAKWMTPNGHVLQTPTQAVPDPPVHDPTKKWFAKENDNMYVTASHNNVTLHILKVGAADAGEFVCHVTNKAGTATERVQLRVAHQPYHASHSEQPVRALPGSAVEVFCEVEAVPAATWSWTSPSGQSVTNDGTKFWIDTAESSQSTTRSKLTMKPSSESDFGNYTCTATNQHGLDSWNCLVVLILSPPVPSQMMTDGRHPTFAKLSIGNYVNLSIGQTPQTVQFRFAKENDVNSIDADFDWETQARLVELEWEPTAVFRVYGMSPETDYLVQARGVTEAGPSEWCASEPYRTAEPSPPSSPVFVQPSSEQQLCDELCRVEWSKPESDGGAQITAYRIEYASMSDASTVASSFTSYTDPLPAHQLQVSLRHLRPNTYYTLRLYALNRYGQSEPVDTVILTPGNLSSPSTVSTGAVVLIVLLVLVGVCALIDIACYFLNQCGFIMFVCVNCCGRPAPEHSLKHTDMHHMEHGQRNDDTQPLKCQGAPPCEDKEPLETTPLNGSTETGLTGKATTV